MSGINIVTLVGNVGQDPEIRHTASGTPVATVSLATSERWKDKQTGETKEKTQWHRLSIWNALAEKVIQPYVHKGDQLAVTGSIEYEEWTDRTGNKRYMTQIKVRDVSLLGGGRATQKPSQPSYQAPPDAAGGDPFDDDIPF